MKLTVVPRFILAAATLTLAATWSIVTLAEAASPIPHATYNGFDRPGNNSFRMQISSDGRSVKTLRVADPLNACGAGASFTTLRNVPISSGRFRVQGVKHLGRATATVTVTGRFLAHRRASGTIAEQNNFSPRCPGQSTWLAVVGSGKPPVKRCGTFLYAKSIVIRGTDFTTTGVTCAKAHTALRNGRFSGPGNGTFTTPGWSCNFTPGVVQHPRPNTSYRCGRGQITLLFLA